ncbi:MAG: TetR/AcrR family transcriptional regulator [Ruthenibacterium lactatiformans]
MEAAREIARRDGLGHISIRRTAAMCGVSVGTVYNYYPPRRTLCWL